MDKEKFLRGKGLVLVGVLAVVLVGGSIGYHFFNKEAPPTAERITYVKTMVANEGMENNEASYPGVIKGRYETNLSFQVPGRIVSKYVQMGQRVHAGEVLMALDDRDLRDNVDSANAQVAAAKSQLELATTTVERYRKLYRENAVPAQTLDQMEANYRAALANYNNAMAQASRGSTALGYAQLKAPGNGVISQVMGEVGQVVGAGQPMLIFVADGGYEVEISVPENRLQGIVLGAPTEVELWSNQNVKIPGKIREIAPMADPATRAYKVRVALEEMPQSLHLGMTAKVFLKQGKQGGIILPLAAIYQVDNKPTVWVVKQDGNGKLRVHQQVVEVQGIDDTHVEVKGLAPDATVVIAGVNKLREDTEVAIMKGDQ